MTDIKISSRELKMKISTATSVFVNYQISDAIEHIIKAGYDGVDLWCGRPHIFRKDHSAGSLQQLRQTLETHHLTPVCLMPAFFRYPFSFSSPIETIRQDSIAYVKDCIDNAVVLGAKQVLIVPNGCLYGQTVEEARRLYIDSLSETCGHAEQKGIKLGLEIVYPKFSAYMGSSEDALTAIKAVGSPCLGVVIDSGHINLSGEPYTRVLDNLGERLLQVHINDNDGFQQQNAIPGEGSFDFAGFIYLLNRNGYDGFLTVELGWHYSFDPFPAVCKALTHTRKYLEKFQ